MAKHRVVPSLLKWGVAVLLLGVLIGVRQWRQSILYPVSDVFINPVTGKLDPASEASLASMTSYKPDVISVNWGNVAGDVSRGVALPCLSPIIRMHHEVNEFQVTWNVLYPNYNVDFEIKYNRGTGVVTETQHSHDPDSTTTRTIGANVTDRDIHAGAALGVEYTQWAAQNWGK